MINTVCFSSAAKKITIQRGDRVYVYERPSKEDRDDMLGLLPLVDAGHGFTTVWYGVNTRIKL